jgi:uncharacterized DUF497 family protein
MQIQWGELKRTQNMHNQAVAINEVNEEEILESFSQAHVSITIKLIDDQERREELATRRLLELVAIYYSPRDWLQKVLKIER